jgi:AraC-like DNA-binding protein/quercetin dioxygenase-like cupin family protein
MPLPLSDAVAARRPAPKAQAIQAAWAPPVPYQPDPLDPVRVRARRLAASTRIEPHRHAWAQVAYSAKGVLRVSAEQHTYIVPPSRAVWIPPGVEHVVTVVEDAELRTLYLHLAVGQDGPSGLSAEPAVAERPASMGHDRQAAPTWSRCRVLEVSPLLRELVEQLGDAATEGQAQTERLRLCAALVQDELRRAPTVSLGVGLPSDKRLRALCEAVLDDPARHATLQGWAGEAGASVRTIARLFQQELGTTFAEWRQQVLLAKALSMAARKRPMAHIAAELGYASASAFSAMVRRSVGVPPSRFFAAV